MQSQFNNLTASELYCPRCRTARPVRERLLLVLPRSELYDFRCKVCGESCGSREVTAPAVSAAHAVPPQARRHATRTIKPAALNNPRRLLR